MKENITKVIKKFIDADANARNKFVLKYIGLFDAKQKLAEESIQRVIDLNRTNTCLTDVLIKVVMINTLYSTFLNSNSPEETRGDQIKEQGKRTLSVDQVARHIVEMLPIIVSISTSGWHILPVSFDSCHQLLKILSPSVVIFIFMRSSH